MHPRLLINIHAEEEKIYICVCDADGTNERKRQEKEKKSFRVCVFVCKIINLLLSDPHLSSFDDGRAAPVGCMFQI